MSRSPAGPQDQLRPSAYSNHGKLQHGRVKLSLSIATRRINEQMQPTFRHLRRAADTTCSVRSEVLHHRTVRRHFLYYQISSSQGKRYPKEGSTQPNRQPTTKQALQAHTTKRRKIRESEHCSANQCYTALQTQTACLTSSSFVMASSNKNEAPRTTNNISDQQQETRSNAKRW